jgi:ABC-type transport system involved in cytochrome bd biosynthesis fused ATPase/permease subunit
MLIWKGRRGGGRGGRGGGRWFERLSKHHMLIRIVFELSVRVKARC